MATDKVITWNDGAVAHLTLNNPKKHNAISIEMWKALEQGLSCFISDNSIRVIVLSGKGGKAFTAGADISEFESGRNSHDATARYEELTTRVYELLFGAKKPTLAMISGYCMGGGLALAACCDIRVCSSISRFGIPAARLGVGYGFSGLRHLVDLVGPAFTKEIFYTARQFTASEAGAMGLVNRVVNNAELKHYVSELATTIANNAPLTVSSVKQIIGQLMLNPENRDLKLCDSLVKACFESDDYVEGRKAFMEKRKPKFKGS